MDEPLKIITLDTDHIWEFKWNKIPSIEIDNLNIDEILSISSSTRLKCYISDVLGHNGYRNLMKKQMNKLFSHVSSNPNDAMFFLFINWQKNDFDIEKINRITNDLIVSFHNLMMGVD